MRRCISCRCELGDELEFMGVEYSQGDADLIVFDMGPPGNEGLGYACGATCFERWVRNDEADK